MALGFKTKAVVQADGSTRLELMNSRLPLPIRTAAASPSTTSPSPDYADVNASALVTAPYVSSPDAINVASIGCANYHQWSGPTDRNKDFYTVKYQKRLASVCSTEEYSLVK